MALGSAVPVGPLQAKRAALEVELVTAQATLAACRVTVDVAGKPMVLNSPASSRARVRVWTLEARLRDVAAALRRAGSVAAGGTVAAMLPAAGGVGELSDA